MARLHRFLTLGTEGGTYYTREPELTKKAAGMVVQMAKDGDPVLVDEVTAISQAGRAPRNNPALFALAAASGLGPEDARRKALDALPLVARTGSHLLTFAAYVEQFRGWGPQLCKAVGRWYNGKEITEVAYQVLKYRQRGGWSQRDLLRLSHFGRTPLSGPRKGLYDYIVHGRPDDRLPLVDAVAKAHATREPARVGPANEGNRSLSWEMLPSEALAEADVWAALIGAGLPMGALIRNLGQADQPRRPGPDGCGHGHGDGPACRSGATAQGSHSPGQRPRRAAHLRQRPRCARCRAVESGHGGLRCARYRVLPLVRGGRAVRQAHRSRRGRIRVDDLARLGVAADLP